MPLIAQKRQGVTVTVVKSPKGKLLHAADVTAFNAQYGNSLAVKTSDKFHDRFLIIDKTILATGANADVSATADAAELRLTLPDGVFTAQLWGNAETLRPELSVSPCDLRLSAAAAKCDLW